MKVSKRALQIAMDWSSGSGEGLALYSWASLGGRIDPSMCDDDGYPRALLEIGKAMLCVRGECSHPSDWHPSIQLRKEEMRLMYLYDVIRKQWEESRVTKVIFRRWRKTGTLIALFPEVPTSHRFSHFCLSYEKVGQHSECDLLAVISNTTPADEQDRDVQLLKKELEQEYGYILDVRKKYTVQMWAAKRRAINELRNA